MAQFKRFDKGFLEVFARYEPSHDLRAVLEAAEPYLERQILERDETGTTRRLEIKLFFKERQPAAAFYKIETEICELYEFKSFRIFPQYPSSLFSLEVMPEIIGEAKFQ